MNDPNVPTAPDPSPHIPQQDQPPQTPQQPVSPAPRSRIPIGKPWLILASVLGFLVMLMVVLSVFRQGDAPAQTDISPPPPVPTQPPRPQSAVASTSAFADFSEAVASLSAEINGFVLNDAELTPPILDTGLGLDE